MSMGYLGTVWDGVSQGYKFIDNGDCSAVLWDGSKLVWDGSYPTDNIKDGILYLDQQNVIDLAPEHKWKEAEGVYINDIGDSTDTSTEPSDLKNTKSNIRKIKPDINSELKRV